MADKDFELIFYHYGTIACSNSCFVQRAIEAAGAARELTLVFARLWSVPALIRDVYLLSRRDERRHSTRGGSNNSNCRAWISPGERMTGSGAICKRAAQRFSQRP
jgi:hypothetical protein